MTDYCDRPCAAEGLASYRCLGRYGFVMLGARDDADALRQAQRSSTAATPDAIERWNGCRYVPIRSTGGNDHA